MSERAHIEAEIGRLMARVTELRRQRREIDIREGKYARALTPRVLAIKSAYVANQMAVREIAGAFGTSAGHVQRLARELAWPRRSPPKCRK